MATISTDTIYRVIVRTTSSRQPDRSMTWACTVLYCGPDRTAARTAYHASTPGDCTKGFGDPARETRMDVIDDAATDDFADDKIG